MVALPTHSDTVPQDLVACRLTVSQEARAVDHDATPDAVILIAQANICALVNPVRTDRIPFFRIQ